MLESSALAHQAGATAMRTLRGTVKDANREAMEGVVVTARTVNRRTQLAKATSVFSDKDGAFSFPALDSGEYQVLAQAVGYMPGKADLTVNPSNVRDLAFSLEPITDVTSEAFTNQLSGAEWMMALPEDTQARRRMKWIFQTTCTGCHAPHIALRYKFDAAGWRSLIRFMANESPDGQFNMKRPRDVRIDHYTDDLVAYLTEMRGPGPSPMRFQKLPRPSGELTRVVLTEFDTTPPANRIEPRVYHFNTWSEGSVSVFRSAGLHDLVSDAKSNLWGTGSSTNWDRTYTKVDATTGQLTNVSIDGGRGIARGAQTVSIDGKGVIWMGLFGAAADPEAASGGMATRGKGSVVMIDSNTEKYEVYTPPGDIPGMGSFLNASLDGSSVWSNGGRGMVRFDVKTKQFSYFESPFMRNEPAAGSYDASPDANGNGWVAIMTHDRMAVADPKTGEVKDIVMPPNTVALDLATEADRNFFSKVPSVTNISAMWSQTPRRIGADPKAPYMWVCNWDGQNLAQIDTRTNQVTLHSSQAAVPFGGCYDVDDNSTPWVTFRNADRVGKFDPATKQWTIYLLPTLGFEGRHISVDRATGDVVLPGLRTAQAMRLHVLR
jgi:streptogramin lyase